MVGRSRIRTQVAANTIICLSFAGEQRPYVSEVAGELSRLGIRVFYDEDEKARLWGKDLYEHLSWIYRKSAKYCILFASNEYAEKVWTTHERRAAQARAMVKARSISFPSFLTTAKCLACCPRWLSGRSKNNGARSC
ncbi:TIR domain-containing protein [Micromonospora sp. b486]|uniref:TIR domain-containing protein n=1 Tax=Micromonospora sp. b486 TaxID=3053986 RepID=UPI00338FC4D9